MYCRKKGQDNCKADRVGEKTKKHNGMTVCDRLDHEKLQKRSRELIREMKGYFTAAKYKRSAGFEAIYWPPTAKFLKSKRAKFYQFSPHYAYTMLQGVSLSLP